VDRGGGGFLEGGAATGAERGQLARVLAMGSINDQVATGSGGGPRGQMTIRGSSPEILRVCNRFSENIA